MPLISLGAVGRRIAERRGLPSPIPVWKIRRLFERRLLPEPTRCGQYRVVPEGDVPRIERALEKAGYLKGEPVHAA